MAKSGVERAFHDTRRFNNQSQTERNDIEKIMEIEPVDAA
jgi:hypothetical protein